MYRIVVIYIKVVVYKLSCLSCEIFLVICSKYRTSHKVLNMKFSPFFMFAQHAAWAVLTVHVTSARINVQYSMYVKQINRWSVKTLLLCPFLQSGVWCIGATVWSTRVWDCESVVKKKPLKLVQRLSNWREQCSA